MSRSPLFFLATGVIVGCFATAGALYAQTKPSSSSSPAALTAPMPGPLSALAGVDVSGQPFEIVDTPGSTYVLNKATGQVWRLSFTDVGGNKYWYGMYAPMEPPTSFEEFRARLRREKGDTR
jgi:hypothetical protein